MIVEYKPLKENIIRASGRSSDYIFPSISQGCAGGCIYCYAARHTEQFRKKLKVSTNIAELLELVKNYDTCLTIKPNQTHEKYITWDLGCNSDLSIDINYFDWQKVFDYFKYSDRDLGTFATKFTNPKLLTYNPDKKIRVRMSLMPEKYSLFFEPRTAKIKDRIRYFNLLFEAGYEVHVNFSPVIITKTWQEDYKELFKLLDVNISDDVKSQLRSEVIFLTHNELMHKRNLKDGYGKQEHFLWAPSLQEEKHSEFGGKNVRYKLNYKNKYIKQFSNLINQTIPYSFIRYIF